MLELLRFLADHESFAAGLGGLVVFIVLALGDAITEWRRG